MRETWPAQRGEDVLCRTPHHRAWCSRVVTASAPASQNFSSRTGTEGGLNYRGGWLEVSGGLSIPMRFRRSAVSGLSSRNHTVIGRSPSWRSGTVIPQ